MSEPVWKGGFAQDQEDGVYWLVLCKHCLAGHTSFQDFCSPRLTEIDFFTNVVPKLKVRTHLLENQNFPLPEEAARSSGKKNKTNKQKQTSKKPPPCHDLSNFLLHSLPRSQETNTKHWQCLRDQTAATFGEPWVIFPLQKWAKLSRPFFSNGRENLPRA